MLRSDGFQAAHLLLQLSVLEGELLHLGDQTRVMEFDFFHLLQSNFDVGLHLLLVIDLVRVLVVGGVVFGAVRVVVLGNHLNIATTCLCI